MDPEQTAPVCHRGFLTFQQTRKAYDSVVRVKYVVLVLFRVSCICFRFVPIYNYTFDLIECYIGLISTLFFCDGIYANTIC